jgi:hypothetical protein
MADDRPPAEHSVSAGPTASIAAVRMKSASISCNVIYDQVVDGLSFCPAIGAIDVVFFVDVIASSGGDASFALGRAFRCLAAVLPMITSSMANSLIDCRFVARPAHRCPFHTEDLSGHLWHRPAKGPMARSRPMASDPAGRHER